MLFYSTRALFDEVWDGLRAVEMIAEPEGFELVFYTEGPISPRMRDSASCVETEILADVDPSVQVRHRLVEIGPKEPISFHGGHVVFLRRTREGHVSTIVNAGDFKPDRLVSLEGASPDRLVVAAAWSLLGEIWMSVAIVRVLIDGPVATMVMSDDGAQAPFMAVAEKAISRRLASLLPDEARVIIRRVYADEDGQEWRGRGLVVFSR